MNYYTKHVTSTGILSELHKERMDENFFPYIWSPLGVFIYRKLFCVAVTYVNLDLRSLLL